MAERPVFSICDSKVVSKMYSFEWFPGFAVSQKQKSIDSLHKAVKEADAQANPLEISSKSANPLGVKLSAFNLCLNNHTLENIFQSAKLFENGGPYLDLLEVPPREAKRDERLHKSGQLKAFCYQGAVFPLTPQTVFYDYIYIQAVKQSLAEQEVRALAYFTHFTDIEFNPKKSINTQARSVALIRQLLADYGELPDLSKNEFIRYHEAH